MNFKIKKDNFSKITNKVKQVIKNPTWQERVVTWGAPATFIPAFRFIQDDKKSPKLRKELFLRDSSSYIAGTGVYFATIASATKLQKSKAMPNVLKKVPGNVKKILPVSAAVFVYCLWCGFCGPQFSKLMVNSDKKQPEKTEPKLKKLDIKETNQPPFLANSYRLKSTKSAVGINNYLSSIKSPMGKI